MAQPKLLIAIAALAAVTTSLHCNQKGANKEKTCTGGQALQSLGIRGASMPPRSVALTFDDGPGERTKVLSRFLKQEGIQAAFFVNGRAMGPSSAEILQQLVDDGHLVANHTESHRSLTGRSTGTPHLTDAEIVQELVDTDAKIEAFIPSKRMLFRPPFGDFDDQALNALNASAMNKYVGPILWDVGDKMDEANGRVADWDCWQDGVDAKRTPMQQCGDLYITEIKRASRGIVLLHDPYYNEQDPQLQGTVDMVMYMVPILKQEGFTFLRVDKIPDVAALLPELPPEEADGGLSTLAPGDPNAAPGENPCP